VLLGRGVRVGPAGVRERHPRPLGHRGELPGDHGRRFRPDGEDIRVLEETRRIDLEHLARDEDARLPVCRRRALDGIEHVVHVALEVVERAEARGVDGDEAVPDVLDLALGMASAQEEIAVHGAR